MSDSLIYNSLLVAAALFSIGTAVFNGNKKANFGRFLKPDKTRQLPLRIGWVLMESPCSLVFFLCFFLGDNRSMAAWLLLFMWQLHYVHRSFIYPFRIKKRPGSSISLNIVLFGGFWCGLNAFLNSTAITTYAPHLTDEWLTDPRFTIGSIIFLLGYWLNKDSDRRLIKLRETTEDYAIPYGGGFKWVTMPNYLGEIITWIGFAIAAWTPAAAVFIFLNVCALTPQALAKHQWSLERFPNYPKGRKAIFPYVL